MTNIQSQKQPGRQAKQPTQTNDLLGAHRRWLLWCGVIGPVLFTAVYLIQDITRAGYGPLMQPISALSLGPGGFIQKVNFLVFALLSFLFAGGLRKGWTRRGIMLFGIGVLTAGLFDGDPANGFPPGAPLGEPTESSWHSQVHFLGGGVVLLLGLAIACFANTRRIAPWSLLAGLGMVGLFLLYAATQFTDAPSGLFERIAVTLPFAWMVAYAIRQLRSGSG